MKSEKQVVDPLQQQLKSLTKLFKNITRDNIRIIFQFCEYDYSTARKALTIINELKKPVDVIHELIKFPEKTQAIIGKYLQQYQKLHDKDQEWEQTDRQIEQKKQQIAQIGYQFFQNVPKDSIMNVMSFLDPYEFFEFSLTSKPNLQISKSEAQNDYYRRLCTKLFKNEQSKLPFICRFQKIRDYVMSRPNQFGPNTKHSVTNRLRQYIWKLQTLQYKTQPQYYKSFGSYQKLFRLCPRIHFNGYYVMRDKYVRIGQKDDKNPVRPIHVIYFYRYLRFLEDGSVIYHVHTKRLKEDQIIKYLSKELLEQKEQSVSLVGQYINHKDKVMIRTVKNQQIFSYQLDIVTEPNQICPELIIKNYTLKLVDDQHQIFQVLFAAKPNLQNKSFVYCRNKQIMAQNSNCAMANSL